MIEKLPEPTPEKLRGGSFIPLDDLANLSRDEQMRIARERVDELLMEGLNSPKREMTEEVWEEIRQEGLRRAAKLRSK